ncbi:MAG: hypothetical protein PHD97_08070 [Bacteroidales bacterium]|nr:hypothetical protein [Bacteroidales bacterium]
MKKFILILTAFSFLFLTTKAQKFGAGAGFTYGTQISTAGINVGGFFVFFKKKMNLELSLSSFSKLNQNFIAYDKTTALWDANLNLRYIINWDVIGIYPIAGLNIANTKIDTIFHYKSPITGEDRENNSTKKATYGLNAGIGFQVNLESVFPFIELKHVFGDYNQSMFTIGLRFKLGKSEEAQQ